jgi:hypothetical protein
MRTSLLALALFTSTCFLAVQIADSTQAVPVSASRPLPHAVKNEVPESCPVTKPLTHPFEPPSPYPQRAGPDEFWIGTNKLWIGVRRDGTWEKLPQWPDGTYRQKLFWWHQGYDVRHDPQPKLLVSGKRLDSSAPPIRSEASNGWTDDAHHPFIVNGINLPSLGCWKISGRFEDTELSFVVWVTQ